MNSIRPFNEEGYLPSNKIDTDNVQTYNVVRFNGGRCIDKRIPRTVEEKLPSPSRHFNNKIIKSMDTSNRFPIVLCMNNHKNDFDNKLFFPS